MLYKFLGYSVIIILSLALIGCGGGSSTPSVLTYSVTGRVTYNGLGLAGVAVKLTSSSTNITATTDEFGTYIIKTLPSGRYTISSADTKYGFDEMSITIDGAALTVLDRVAYPGFNLTGKVTRTDGTPVAGAAVRLYGSSFTIYSTLVTGRTYYGTKNSNGVESVKNETVLQVLSANANGVFTFNGVRSGTYTIQPTSTTPLNMITITESGMVYIYDTAVVSWSSNKLSADGATIYNTVEPLTISGNTLGGLDFEIMLGGVKIDL